MEDTILVCSLPGATMELPVTNRHRSTSRQQPRYGVDNSHRVSPLLIILIQHSLHHRLHLQRTSITSLPHRQDNPLPPIPHFHPLQSHMYHKHRPPLLFDNPRRSVPSITAQSLPLPRLIERPLTMPRFTTGNLPTTDLPSPNPEQHLLSYTMSSRSHLRGCRS
jgi:hypothetical protein